MGCMRNRNERGRFGSRNGSEISEMVCSHGEDRKRERERNEREGLSE